jgi:hypothetical protein
MQIIRLVVAGQIDAKTAGLVLYALQTASANLARTNFEPYMRSMVLDPRTVSESQLGRNVWDVPTSPRRKRRRKRTTKKKPPPRQRPLHALSVPQRGARSSPESVPPPMSTWTRFGKRSAPRSEERCPISPPPTYTGTMGIAADECRQNILQSAAGEDALSFHPLIRVGYEFLGSFSDGSCSRPCSVATAICLDLR